MITPNYSELTIENVNLKLTPIDVSNISDIIEHNTGNVREFFIPFESKEEVNKWIIEQQEKMKIGEKIELVIVDKKSSEFIGMVSLDNLLNNTKIEPRLWIAPRYQNKGYGKQSLKLLIDWYKSENTNKTIHYIADINNRISQKLALSLGFVFQRQYIDEYGDDLIEFIK